MLKTINQRGVEVMSIDLIVYLRRSAMPTPDQWQQAIRKAGFPVELDTDFDVDTMSGFLPCQFRGVTSGFEYWSDSVTEQEQVGIQAPLCCNFH